MAFTNSFAPIRDLRSLGQALWDGVEHHLLAPGEQRQALAVLKRSLADKLGQRDRTLADWFLAGAPQPTNRLAAYPQSQVAHPSSSTEVAASASMGQCASRTWAALTPLSCRPSCPMPSACTSSSQPRTTAEDSGSQRCRRPSVQKSS